MDIRQLPSSSFPAVVTGKSWKQEVPEDTLRDFLQKNRERKAKKGTSSSSKMKGPIHFHPQKISWWKEDSGIGLGGTVKAEVSVGVGGNGWQGEPVPKWFITTEKDTSLSDIKSLGCGDISRSGMIVQLTSSIPCWGTELKEIKFYFNSEAEAQAVEENLIAIKAAFLRYVEGPRPAPSPIPMSISESSPSGGISEGEGMTPDLELEEGEGRGSN